MGIRCSAGWNNVFCSLRKHKRPRRGGGDELTLRFQPPTGSAEGHRAYVFLWNGYYKTLKEDIPHTVEPLPFAAMSNFPYPDTESYPTDAEHDAYWAEWNTRYED
jgi:hypothetical protein